MIFFEDLLKSFCAEFNIHVSPLEQRVSFVLNEKYEVTLEGLEDPASFVIYASFYLPAGDRQTALERVLKAHIFGKQTKRAVFAMDPRSEGLILFRRFDNEVVDFKYFKDELGHFVAVLSYWDHELRR